MEAESALVKMRMESNPTAYTKMKEDLTTESHHYPAESKYNINPIVVQYIGDEFDTKIISLESKFDLNKEENT